MRIAVFSDDYFFMLGLSAMLSCELGNKIHVKGYHIHRYMQINSKKFNADMIVFSLSTIGKALEMISFAKHYDFKVLIFTPKCYPRLSILSNAAVIKKNSSIVEIVKKIDGVLSLNGKRLMTPREFRVLSLLLKGVTISTIGSILGISNKTVSLHKMNGLRKLGLRRFQQLI